MYSFDQENRGRWLVFDADDQEKWSSLKALSEGLQQRAIPSFLELSHKGGHLWLFFSEALRGKTLLALGKALTKSVQVQVEIFPNREHEGGPGSLVRLPFGIHQRDGHRYLVINPDGGELGKSVREQLAILNQAPKVPTVFVADTLTEMAQSERERTRVIPTEPKLDTKLAQMDLYNFVSQYIELTPNGKGHCPFHPDTHMSFSVNRKGNYWNCFAGCGVRNIVAFWAKWRGISRIAPIENYRVDNEKVSWKPESLKLTLWGNYSAKAEEVVAIVWDEVVAFRSADGVPVADPTTTAQYPEFPAGRARRVAGGRDTIIVT